MTRPLSTWPARLARPALAAATLAVAVVAASLAASPMANAAGNTASNAGAALKSFEPQSIGQIAAERKGKPFVVLVWSMDCEFCQHSLDVLSKARAANPSFDIVTITTDPLADAALSAMVRKRLSGIDLLAQFHLECLQLKAERRRFLFRLSAKGNRSDIRGFLTGRADQDLGDKLSFGRRLNSITR